MIRSCLLAIGLLLGTHPAWGATPVKSASAAPVILVLGDSLSAAYGVPLERGWVALLQARLQARGYPQQVVNASVSGETTAGGLVRLPDLLAAHHPQWVLIELGANDGLRALPLDQLAANLRKMIALSRAAGAKPVLFEMLMPPNYGPDYANGFRDRFSEVSRLTHTPMVPFFMAAIADDPAAYQPDGLHPVAAAQPALLDAVWPSLEPLLKP